MPIRRLEGGKTATSTPPSLAWQGGEVRGEVETRWRLFCSQHNSQKAVREKMRKMKRLLYSTANADEAVSRWRKVTTPTKHPHLWSGRTERCGGGTVTNKIEDGEDPHRQRVSPLHREAVVRSHRRNQDQMMISIVDNECLLYIAGRLYGGTVGLRSRTDEDKMAASDDRVG